MAKLPSDVSTLLAWQFDSVLPGHFRRKKLDYAHIDFPILGPLPANMARTKPREGAALLGPFIYFVLDGSQEVRYVGKSKEASVIKRWVRPGVGGPSTHYWTHTNKNAGCVRRIAAGISSGQGPFELRFTPLEAIPKAYTERFIKSYPGLPALDRAERGMISLLEPAWNAS